MTTTSRVNEIDLLRFFAAIVVVLFHLSFRGYAADGMSVMPYEKLSSASKYGYLGVDLFFMISGFVILMTAANGSLRGFIVSRLVRLYPAFWACCTITFLLIVAIGAPRFSASLSQYLVNMTMLSGFLGVPAIDGVYWSLFVEMRFYALVAIVLAFGKIGHSQLLLALWLAVSIALEVMPSGKLRYLFIVDYSAYFITGATYYLIWANGVSRYRLGIVAVSWCLALYKAVGQLPAFEKHYEISMSSLVVSALISTSFVVMLLIATRRTSFFGRIRWRIAGALTYPLYLLHQNIGYMVFNLAYPTVAADVLFLGVCLGLLGLAYAVHIHVEQRYAAAFKAALERGLASIDPYLVRFRDVLKARR